MIRNPNSYNKRKENLDKKLWLKSIPEEEQTKFFEILKFFKKLGEDFENIDFIIYCEYNGYDQNLANSLHQEIEETNSSNVQVIITLQMLMLVLGKYSSTIYNLYFYSSEKYIMNDSSIKYLKSKEKKTIERRRISKLNYKALQNINNNFFENNKKSHQNNMKQKVEEEKGAIESGNKEEPDNWVNNVSVSSTSDTKPEVIKKVVKLEEFKIFENLIFNVIIDDEEAKPLIQKIIKQFQNTKEMDAFKLYKSAQNIYNQHADWMAKKGSGKPPDVALRETFDLILILRRDGYIQKSTIIDYWISNMIMDPEIMQETSKAIFNIDYANDSNEEEKKESRSSEGSNSAKVEKKPTKSKKMKLDKKFKLFGTPDEYAILWMTILRSYFRLNMGSNKEGNIWSTTSAKLSNLFKNYIVNTKNARVTSINSLEIIKKDDNLKALVIRLLHRLRLIEISDDLQIDQEIERIKNYREVFEKDQDGVREEFKRIICELSSSDL